MFYWFSTLYLLWTNHYKTSVTVVHFLLLQVYPTVKVVAVIISIQYSLIIFSNFKNIFCKYDKNWPWTMCNTTALVHLERPDVTLATSARCILVSRYDSIISCIRIYVSTTSKLGVRNNHIVSWCQLSLLQRSYKDHRNNYILIKLVQIFFPDELEFFNIIGIIQTIISWTS